MARPHPTNVNHVASIGGGPIGAGWAAHFLARGYDVSAYLHDMAEAPAFHSVVDTAWISAGLERGDRLVLTPLALVVDGMRVQVAAEKEIEQ